MPFRCLFLNIFHAPTPHHERVYLLFWTATLTIVKDIANHFAVSVLPSMHHPRYFRVGNGQHIIYKIGVYQDPLVFY